MRSCEEVRSEVDRVRSPYVADSQLAPQFINLLKRNPRDFLFNSSGSHDRCKRGHVVGMQPKETADATGSAWNTGCRSSLDMNARLPVA